MIMPKRRTVRIFATAVCIAAPVLVAAGPAVAASPDVVISQVYGGGGNTGATHTNDFIELHNRGSAPVDVSGWSVQYASAAGTSYQVTRLTGSVAPGKHYLVAEAAGAGAGAPLPTPDATGTISMSATSGKVALVAGATALTCGTSCAAAPGVRDFVGYGSANDSESAPTRALSNSTAALRGTAADSDNNATDFTVGAPNPRNSGSTPGPGPGPAPTKKIREVQGAAHRSPLEGQSVTVAGVVTGVDAKGFWLQDAQADDNPATSEGVYVFVNAAPTVVRGDEATVAGKVTEFRPGSKDGPDLTITELTAPTVSVTGKGKPLPAPTLVGPGGRVAPVPVRSDQPGDVEKSTSFDVTANALDFHESLEGMLIRVQDPVAVGPTNSFGELALLPGGVGSPRTVRGGVRYTYEDANAEKITLDDKLAKVPAANVGDRIAGAVDGIVDYSFGEFKVQVLATPTVQATGPKAESTRPQRNNELAVATFNVENLDPSDPAAKFDRLAGAVVKNLASPDIIVTEEVQDNNGATNDGTVAADKTLGMLVAAITKAGGPTYAWKQIDPTNNADGGEPGGNIRVAFLYRTDRDLTFVEKPGGNATTPTDVVKHGNHASLTLSPGRIDPGNAAFNASRKPIAGEFKFRGRPFVVVGNHFNSKGGDQPLFGRFQPPTRPSETQRHAQAEIVNAFVNKIRATDRETGVIVAGDINDFEFSKTTDLLVRSTLLADKLKGRDALVDLPRTLPEAERYSYVFQGNSQILDHILLSPSLVGLGFEYDIVHLNSEYGDQMSDHDPSVTRVAFRPGG